MHKLSLALDAGGRSRGQEAGGRSRGQRREAGGGRQEHGQISGRSRKQEAGGRSRCRRQGGSVVE